MRVQSQTACSSPALFTASPRAANLSVNQTGRDSRRKTQLLPHPGAAAQTVDARSAVSRTHLENPVAEAWVLGMTFGLGSALLEFSPLLLPLRHQLWGLLLPECKKLSLVPPSLSAQLCPGNRFLLGAAVEGKRGEA